MIKKKVKLNKKNFIAFIIMIISFLIFIITTISIIKWKLDSNNTNKQVNKLNDININEIKDSDKTEIINQENINDDDPYWNFIKMSLIKVDFKELKKQNNQTVGWIKVEGTNINYPFVQTTNNSYYLNHSFNKSYNNAGWVFLDYRNNIKTLDKNTIIYAHGRLNNTMFGSLRNILKSKWLNDSNNYIVKMSTETENTLWQVFSVYRIPTTNDYIRVNFSSNGDYQSFLNLIHNRSQFNFNTSISTNDKILTLSTCYNNKDKVVLHAKLIKRESRT